MEPGTHRRILCPQIVQHQITTSNDFIALRAYLTIELHSIKETHLRIKDVNLLSQLI